MKRLRFCVFGICAAAAVFAACENPWMKEAVGPLYKDKDGGDNNDGGGGWGPAPVPTLYSIAEIEAWIAEQVPLGYGVSVAWPTLGGNVFENTGTGTLTIHVPAGTVGNYTGTWGVANNPSVSPADNAIYGINHKTIEITAL